MKVNRLELLQVLNIIKKGLATKEIVEQSTSFVFKQGMAIAFNDEVAISHPVNLDIEGAVQAKELISLLTKLKDEEVLIECDGAELLIKGKKAKSGITMNTEVLLPLEEIGEASKWKKLPSDFVDGLSVALSSTSKDMTRPVLTCLHLVNDCIESSDGFRVTRYTFKKKIFQDPILLPATSAAAILGMDLKAFSYKDSWIHFKTTGKAIVSCRTEVGEFLEIEDILSQEGEHLKLPKALNEMLDRSEVFLSNDFSADNLIQVKIVDKKITIRGEGSGGWYEESTRVKYQGEELDFMINPHFLKKIHLFKDAVITENTMRFEGESFKHSVILMAN